jgi:hypothetical protein
MKINNTSPNVDSQYSHRGADTALVMASTRADTALVVASTSECAAQRRQQDQMDH